MSTKESGRPWVGPRPYRENEWRQFFGRFDEVNEVERRISQERLTILAGRSGTGKTSLLLAGIIPRLRLRRLRSAENTTWPVLVLRNWGASAQTTFHEMLMTEIEQGLEELKAWEGEGERASEDFELLRGKLIEHRGGPIGEVFYHLSMADPSGGGIIVVFDQLEELLRLGGGITREVTNLLRQLFGSGWPIRLLLSLREEHIGGLRGLERKVGGVMSRTVFLTPMAEPRAREAVEDAAEATGTTLTPDAVKEIFGWLRRAGLLSAREGGATGETFHEGDLTQDEAGAPTVDLLTLQTVLYEIYERAVAKGEEGSVAIDDELLRGYVEDLGVEPEKVVKGALTRWIEHALSEEGGAKVLNTPEGIAIREFRGLVRRIAARMGSHLSSAGYKVAQEEGDLFRKAVGEDIWGLGLRDPELRTKIEIQERKGGKGSELNLEELGLHSDEGEASLDYVSGVAARHCWSRAETARMLVAAFRAALETLGKKEINVVKATHASYEDGRAGRLTRWELVHDGLGTPFAEWSERVRNSWEDCASSVVACRGISPIGLPSDPLEAPSGVLGNVRWEGCHIAPIRRGEKVKLDGVNFESCILRGCIFENVVLAGCRFEGCDLSGVIFRDCDFEAGEKGEGTVFLDCNPQSMAVIRSGLVSVAWKDCDLTQLTVAGCELKGDARFEACRLLLSNFVGFWGQEGERRIEFDERCKLEFCSGDREAWETWMRREGEEEHSTWLGRQ